MNKKLRIVLPVILFALVITTSAFAQFEEPEFKKIDTERAEWFMNKFEDVSWTGRGLYRKTDLDDTQTNEIRARLQTVFGAPTKTLEDLINTDSFRPGQAIQFEYWFTVNDSIPLMVLDVDGPFTDGLVFGGASKYIDLMPQIKRTFARKLLEVEALDPFQDYFYSPEREQWFKVAYKNGKYKTKEISSPDGMTIDFDY
ncbi:hypothetical protein [Fodinibius halophilus]|uniref:Uncharacterized protein n=1 Tax=Fodinibius halophilus TaxID=1736908 RepID=A0A6M1TFB2_9BACT|nr:hypothetical protein [Fodinibius halophilus]NGP89474.1 hypothetical protein [Fodinibius halophilus]